MKIVLVSTNLQGGAGEACHRLGRALRDLGHEVKILVAEEQENMLYVEEIRQKRAFIVTFFLERLFFVFYEASKKVRWSFSPAIFGVDISKHKAVLEADVIHLHWINNGFLSLKNMAQLQTLGKPIVWTLHDMWAFTGGCHYSGECTNFKKGCNNCKYLRQPGSHDLSFSVSQRKKKLFSKKNWQFVTCSNWLGDLAKTSLLLAKYPITVIPNPIDTNIFKPQEMLKKREELFLPKDKKLLLFIATNIKDERKGFTYLSGILDKLKRDNTDNIALVIVGKADQIILDKLNYPSHYLGTIESEEEMVKVYAACDFLIAPSLEDNLPNIIMESMACGTPVLAFATGGIPEMITHNEQGYIAQYKDINDLTYGLRWFLDMSPELYQTLRESCVRKVHNLYTYKNIGEQYSKIYEKITTATPES